MDYLINASTIRNYLGGASFVSGLICFTYGSTYDRLFGKLGFGGLIVYLGISLSIFYLIWGFKRIRVPERFQVVVETILSVAIYVISVGLDKLVPGKSDAWSIISYGLFALMSVSTSRKSELGFKTGFFSFFFVTVFGRNLQNQLETLFVCCNFLFVHPCSSPPLTIKQSLLPTSNQENNQEESYEAAHHPPSNNGGVLEESILEVVWDNQQNNDQEETHSSFPVESSYSYEQDHDVSSANYQNGYVHSSPPRQLLRRRRMTRAIQNISSSLGDTLRRLPPPLLFSFVLFFFKKFPDIGTREFSLRGHRAYSAQ
ncbi:hypothetical protein K1719_029102 [Acacia pycnantha]|nr:hypothetical protein K1719_029102 [Acacia pycnantha]